MITCRTFHSLGLVLVVSIAVSAAGQQTFQTDVMIGDEKVQITIKKAPFDYTAHRFERAKRGELLVDGMPALGTDASDPRTHLSEFRVDWNGRLILVPKSLFQFVFNPSLEPKTSSFENKGSVLVLGGLAGDSVLVQLSGGDGAGSFNSWWVISKNGRVDRFVNGPP